MRINAAFLAFILALVPVLAPVPAQAQAPAPAPVPLAGVVSESLDRPQRTGGQTAAQVLEIPLNSSRMVELPGDVAYVDVANEEIADVRLDTATKRKMFVNAKGLGSTSLFVLDRSGAVILQYRVQVDINADSINSLLTKLLPGERVDVTTHEGTVFLGGQVRSAAAASRVVDVVKRVLPEESQMVNMLKVEGRQQVILQVRVAEVSRSALKGLSVNQEFAAGNLLFDRGISFRTSAPGVTDSFGAGTLNARLPLMPGVAAFEVLERQGLVKTLAEPTLVALSGETANFLSGGEYPFPTGTDQNGNVTYEFRDFGIKLNFTPVVADPGLINLQIAVEVSEIDTTNQITIGTLTINSIATKRTETTVDLPSGGNLMISGLISNNFRNTINGIPWLKDVPVLGALFRSTNFRNDESELVVLVKTMLAKPVDGEQRLAMPTDGLAPPSDADLYLLGRLHKEHKGGEETSPWRLPIRPEGPFGYIMERQP